MMYTGEACIQPTAMKRAKLTHPKTIEKSQKAPTKESQPDNSAKSGRNKNDDDDVLAMPMIVVPNIMLTTTTTKLTNKARICPNTLLVDHLCKCIKCEEFLLKTKALDISLMDENPRTYRRGRVEEQAVSSASKSQTRKKKNECDHSTLIKEVSHNRIIGDYPDNCRRNLEPLSRQLQAQS